MNKSSGTREGADTQDTQYSMCETQKKKSEKRKNATQLRLCISIRCAHFQNLLKHTDRQTHSRQECMTAHKRRRGLNWGGLWEQISQMEKGWRKERKKGLETAIFLCEPPARINANSLILLPLFLVFPPPSISRFYPPSSPPHCALILLFSYHAVLSAHIVFISFVYLVSHFLKGHITEKKSATSWFFPLSPFFPFLPHSSVPLRVSFTCCVPHRSHVCILGEW